MARTSSFGPTFLEWRGTTSSLKSRTIAHHLRRADDENEENREGFYRSERSYGQFYRAIPLPEGVNADQCEATFKDGVLEVSLKAPQQRENPRQIPIR